MHYYIFCLCVIYISCHSLTVQLGHELNRIMGSDVVSYINHTWKILCPKIVAIGKDEGSGKQHVNELMCGLPSNIPDGI